MDKTTTRARLSRRLRSTRSRTRRWFAFVGILTLLSATSVTPRLNAVAPSSRSHGDNGVLDYSGLTKAQRADLRSIAKQTWKFYGADVDPRTHLPLDNLTYANGSSTPTTYGRYTSSANIGVYLWAVVAAQDLGLVSHREAARRVRKALETVSRLKSFSGFLYQWYDTSTGAVLRNPGDAACPIAGPPAFDNCSFISNVDNGWYASGLIVVRQAMPSLRRLVDRLIEPMDFGLFYDGRPQTHCNTNPAIAGNQPTGQMYGGYYVGLPPDDADNWTRYYHNGALYSDPRMSAYLGMGMDQMPGDVWWRSWRALPPPAPFPDCQSTDPDFSWQGQWPMGGSWQTVTDPKSAKQFPVWEGHYTYPALGGPASDLTFVPTYGGGMFEAMMANEVVPETSWGPNSFGLANARAVQVQIKYATEQLGLPVWGMSPSSTADDTGGYATYGVEGLQFPYVGAGATATNPSLGLSQCHGCATEDVVTPHASFLALDVAPQEAYANLAAMRALYPDVYGPVGFFDALNPTTGAVGHRYLVLDQSMIMASLDNALNNRAMQRRFASDRTSAAARTYLSMEDMFVD
jgi:Putative glucoamylase/Protein of unknown function (DUF3131)